MIADHISFPSSSHGTILKRTVHMLPKFPGKSRGALWCRVLGDETLDIGAPIDFSGASLEELRDEEDLPWDCVRR